MQILYHKNGPGSDQAAQNGTQLAQSKKKPIIHEGRTEIATDRLRSPCTRT